MSMMQGANGDAGGKNSYNAGMSKLLHLITDLKITPGADIPFLVNLETEIIGHMTGGAGAGGQGDPNADPGMGMGAGDPSAMGGGAMGGQSPGQPFGAGLPVSGGVPGMPPQPATAAPPMSRMPPGPVGPGNMDELRRVLSQAQGG